MNYIIMYDTTHNKILRDEEINVGKGISYGCYGKEYEYNLYICSTRDICLKHLKADIKKEIKELTRECNKFKRALNKIERNDK